MSNRLVLLTQDEEWSIPDSISSDVKTWLDKMELDSYNNQYVITVTIDKVQE